VTSIVCTCSDLAHKQSESAATQGAAAVCAARTQELERECARLTEQHNTDQVCLTPVPVGIVQSQAALCGGPPLRTQRPQSNQPRIKRDFGMA